MKAAELQRLIVERRVRAHQAGQWQPIATWLKQSHGVDIDAHTCEMLYIAAQQTASKKQ